MREVAAGVGVGLTHSIKKNEVNYIFLLRRSEAQQGRVYTGDRSKCEMTKENYDARWQVKMHGPVLLD